MFNLQEDDMSLSSSRWPCLHWWAENKKINFWHPISSTLETYIFDLQRIVSFSWESPENLKKPYGHRLKVHPWKESLGLLTFRDAVQKKNRIFLGIFPKCPPFWESLVSKTKKRRPFGKFLVILGCFKGHFFKNKGFGNWEDPPPL